MGRSGRVMQLLYCLIHDIMSLLHSSFNLRLENDISIVFLIMAVTKRFKVENGSRSSTNDHKSTISQAQYSISGRIKILVFFFVCCCTTLNNCDAQSFFTMTPLTDTLLLKSSAATKYALCCCTIRL